MENGAAEMKHIRGIAAVVAVIIALVTFALQAQEQPKKRTPEPAKTSEHASKMNSTEGAKMSCCESDSACAEGGKTCCEK